MSVDIRQALELVALQLAGIVGAIHLWWGLDRFVEQYLQYGYYQDPRPFVFVFTVALLIAGVAYVALDGQRLPVYLGGIGLMLAYLSGYFWWHLTGHGAWVPWTDQHGHTHNVDIVTYFASHITESPIAMTSKLAEALTIVVLTALVYLHYTRGPDGESLDEHARPDPDDRQNVPDC